MQYFWTTDKDSLHLCLRCGHACPASREVNMKSTPTNTARRCPDMCMTINKVVQVLCTNACVFDHIMHARLLGRTSACLAIALLVCKYSEGSNIRTYMQMRFDTQNPSNTSARTCLLISASPDMREYQ